MHLDVVVTRGSTIESRHRVHAAVVNASGLMLEAAGDPELVTFWRSCAKPLQVLPLVHAGGLEKFGWGEHETALACGSHGGEPEHVAVAARMLATLGLDERDLACGPSTPMTDRGSRLLREAGTPPTRLHNNCSGKHAAMLARATVAGWPLRGYQERDHPVQQEALIEVSAWAGVDPADVPIGIDGCGVSVFALSLKSMALAYAKFGEAIANDAGPAAVVGRAMKKRPFLVAGTNRFDTILAEESGGRILAKVGAEGVHSVMIPARGLGFAIKVEDGALRAQHAAVLGALRAFDELPDALTGRLATFARPQVINTRGEVVGEVRLEGETE